MKKLFYLLFAMCTVVFTAVPQTMTTRVKYHN